MARNIFSWIGAKEQQRVLNQTREHMAKVREVVDRLEGEIRVFLADNLAELPALHEALSRAEHEADVMRRSLLESLSEGLLLPPDRQDLVHLVERIDDVADYANSGSRLLVLFRQLPPEEIRDGIGRFGHLLQRAVEKLEAALEHLYRGDIRQTLEQCTAVETIEEEADLLKADLYRILFDLNVRPAKLLLLHDLIESMENTADKAEDSADVVRIIAIKYRG